MKNHNQATCNSFKEFLLNVALLLFYCCAIFLVGWGVKFVAWDVPYKAGRHDVFDDMQGTIEAAELRGRIDQAQIDGYSDTTEAYAAQQKRFAKYLRETTIVLRGVSETVRCCK